MNYLEIVKNKRIKAYEQIFWFVLVNIVLIVLATIRKNVGVDCETYRNIFWFVQVNGFEEAMDYYMEKGYMLLNFFTSLIFQETWGIFFVSAVFLLVLFFLVIRQHKFEISYSMAYLLFFTVMFHVYLNISRQVLAAMIMLLGIGFLVKRKWINYILCGVFAFSFHRSVIIWFLVVILAYCGRHIIKRNANLYFVLCLFSPIWIKYILDFVYKLLIYVAPRYLAYFDRQTISGFGYYLYILPALVLLYLFYYEKMCSNDYYMFLYILLWLQIPFQSINIYTLDRISVYSSVLQIVLVPILLYQTKVNKRLKYAVFASWYIFRLLVMEFYMTGNGTAVYQTIFSGV